MNGLYLPLSSAVQESIPFITENPQQSVSEIGKWLSEVWNFILAFLPKLTIGIVIFAAGWWISKKITKLIKKAMIKASIEPAAISFISQIALFLMRIIVIITAIAQIGIDVTTIITTLCGATVTLGLALKDSLSNLASGVLIIINKPFKKGDYVEFEGLQGTVAKIEIMNTFLNTIDNKEVIIPNSRLTANNLINYSSNGIRRLDLSYQVSYDTDIIKAKKLLTELTDGTKMILKEPAPLIAVAEHSNSSISIAVKVWCDKDDYWDLYYKMQESVKLMFDENGIEIPFDQIVIHNGNIKENKQTKQQIF